MSSLERKSPPCETNNERQAANLRKRLYRLMVLAMSMLYAPEVNTPESTPVSPVISSAEVMRDQAKKRLNQLPLPELLKMWKIVQREVEEPAEAEAQIEETPEPAWLLADIAAIKKFRANLETAFPKRNIQGYSDDYMKNAWENDYPNPVSISVDNYIQIVLDHGTITLNPYGLKKDEYEAISFNTNTAAAMQELKKRLDAVEEMQAELIKLEAEWTIATNNDDEESSALLSDQLTEIRNDLIDAYYDSN